MLGAITASGGKAFKSFTVAINDPTFFDTLNSVRCDGSHEHEQLVGGKETAAWALHPGYGSSHTQRMEKQG